MDIALLNSKIIIQKTSFETDEVGNQLNVWKDFYHCFATISGEGGKENVSETTLDASSISFTLRWCSRLSLVNSTEYRILFNGSVYDITSVDHLNFKKKAIKLSCTRVNDYEQ